MYSTGNVRALALAGALAALSANALGQGASRRLAAVTAPQHAPLFVDSETVKRRGSVVSFKYILDVPPSPEQSKGSDAWRSNEVEASIDCDKKTVTVRRLVAYSGPRGTGSATAAHSYLAPSVKPGPIARKTTFAYLEAHLCP